MHLLNFLLPKPTQADWHAWSAWSVALQRPPQSNSMEVRETNLDAQLFQEPWIPSDFSVEDFYADTTEDAYLMQFRMAGSQYGSGLGRSGRTGSSDGRVNSTDLFFISFERRLCKVLSLSEKFHSGRRLFCQTLSRGPCSVRAG